MVVGPPNCDYEKVLADLHVSSVCIIIIYASVKFDIYFGEIIFCYLTVSKAVIKITKLILANFFQLL